MAMLIDEYHHSAPKEYTTHGGRLSEWLWVSVRGSPLMPFVCTGTQIRPYFPEVLKRAMAGQRVVFELTRRKLGVTKRRGWVAGTADWYVGAAVDQLLLSACIKPEERAPIWWRVRNEDRPSVKLRE